MLSKESHYLTIGCLVFGSLALPVMLGLFVHDLLKTTPATSADQATAMNAPQAPAPPLQSALPMETRRRPIRQREGIQLSIAPPIGDELPLKSESQNLIEVEVLKQRLYHGFELQFRVTNRTPTSLNLINFELDFYGEEREYLGMSAASCFSLAAGESKVVNAVSYESFADRVRDYDLRLENAIGTDDEPVRQLQLKVTAVNLLCSS